MVDKLNELLRDNPELAPHCLSRALLVAVRRDDNTNIGTLIIKGATNIDEALELAKRERKHNARALLLLVKAAVENDRNLVLRLFGALAPSSKGGDISDEGFQEVQSAVTSGKVSTAVPIELARRSQHKGVREELLLRTNVNQQEGTVFWHDLQLNELEVAWLRKVQWVKELRLAHNGFKFFPNEIDSCLRHVVKLDLQSNELKTIPNCILELPSLVDLNLSSNRLTILPDLPEWSSQLTVLDLSHNCLTTIPGKPLAPSIRTLNLADNDFGTVPLCVCSFVTLQSLDLSDNKNILSLPPQMGKLKELTELNLKGLKDLNDPPKNFQHDPADCIRYLRGKLLGAKGYYRMKVMLVGKQNCGKTTLVARLQGKECGNESTVGVDVSEWEYSPGRGKPKFSFSIWDFGGQEEYYATHQCFLSERSLYLLLFNVKHGDAGVEELKPWLNNIALRAPSSCILIVGTHLDEVAETERGLVDNLLQNVAEVANNYRNYLHIKEVLAVGLKNRLENVGLLKDAIYNNAAEYSVTGQLIMGQMIPASYHQLDKVVTAFQKEVRSGARDPIMHKEDFKNHVLHLNLDILEEDELKTVTLFLNNVGTLLHYEDHRNNLGELYFIDPRWLYDMMARIVKNTFIVDGIQPTKSIPFLFHDVLFPRQYFEQFLALLDRFEIALPLDKHRILVPSMLSEVRPAGIDITEMNDEPLYIRNIFFTSSTTPPGFWSRLISQIMYSIPQVWYALSATSEVDLGGMRNPVGSLRRSTETSESLKSSTELSSRSTELFAKSYNESADIQSVNSMTSLNMGAFFQLDEETFHAAFRAALPTNFDPSQARVVYWRTGLFYQDRDVVFRVESLAGSLSPEQPTREGVVIAASPSTMGKRIVGVLIDLVTTLVNDWYPGMRSDDDSLEQIVLCPECIRMKRPEPYGFDVQKCFTLVGNKKTTIDCVWSRDESAKNHTVPLASVVPDLLLQDISAEFLLHYAELDYEEEGNSVLGKGGFAKVYRGRCRGKSVAIKKYKSGDDALSELRRDAMLLQQSHHPCLVCLVGVCVHLSMVLVLEEAPMGSLERPLIKLRQPIHRVVIHPIAAQVAAALKFLHNSGIIYRDLKAANVLLWSLDPESLCHCKVTDFEIATYAAPVGARGLHGTKGFTAPEILHYGRKRNAQYMIIK